MTKKPLQNADQNDRVTFRPLTLDDARSVLSLYDDPKIAYFSASVPLNPSLEWAKDRIKAHQNSAAEMTRQEFGLFLLDSAKIHVLLATALWFTDSLTGSGQARIEIGYCVHRDWRGQGLAKRVLSLIVERAIDHFGEHEPLYAKVATENSASIHILESAGFVRIARCQGTSVSRPGTSIACYSYRLDPAHRGKAPPTAESPKN